MTIRKGVEQRGRKNLEHAGKIWLFLGGRIKTTATTPGGYINEPP